MRKHKKCFRCEQLKLEVENLNFMLKKLKAPTHWWEFMGIDWNLIMEIIIAVSIAVGIASVFAVVIGLVVKFNAGC